MDSSENEPENVEREPAFQIPSIITIIEPKEELKPFLRMPSLNVELLANDDEFYKYFVDFSIDYVVKNRFNAEQKQIHAEKLKKMLKSNESNPKFQMVTIFVDELLDEAVTLNSSEDNTELSRVPEIVDAYKHDFYIDLSDMKKVCIPSVWTPSYKRVNASLIYLFFRHVSLLRIISFYRR